MTLATSSSPDAPGPKDRPATRRDRQLLEISTLIAAGDRDRAAGLALEHLAAFPDDADLLARMGP